MGSDLSLIHPIHISLDRSVVRRSFQDIDWKYSLYQEGAPYDAALQQQQVPVELDARSAVPESPSTAPPQYATNRFSFRQGGDAPPGVEKVLRD